MIRIPRVLGFGILCLSIAWLTACSGTGALNQSAGNAQGTAGQALGGPVPAAVASLDTDTSTDADFSFDETHSVLKQLDDQTVIGSTVDPINGDVNPYGLDIAKSDNGKLERGDLVVCNFNDSANVQGTGTTIIALHPHPGASPRRIARDSALLGCTEVALAPDDTIWASAFAANDNPVISPDGVLLTALAGGPFHGPFGEAFAPPAGPHGVPAFYESNASNGTIVRIGIHPGPRFSFEVIATGFSVNHGVPGSILGPSGLQYDAQHDRLYVVDGNDNTVVAFRHVSTIPEHGIIVHGTSFGGPFARRGRLIFCGPPLNGPISSALLPDGHLIIGNTLDASGKNLLIELTPHGRVLDVRNVDKGAAGALFGIVAAGYGDDVRIFFNDDNQNEVEELSR